MLERNVTVFMPPHLVRQVPRESSDCHHGVRLSKESFNRALKEIHNTLDDEELNANIYLSKPSEDFGICFAKAYFPDREQYGNEPVVIDYNGRSMRGMPMFSIAVRRCEGEGRYFYDLLTRKLASIGIDPEAALNHVNDTWHDIPADLKVFRMYFDERMRGAPRGFGRWAERFKETLRGIGLGPQPVGSPAWQ